jgi:hypothetical protein
VTIRARYKGATEVVHPGDEQTPRWERPVESLPGIPARDLTDDDWDQLTPELRDVVRKDDLYEYIPQSRGQTETAPAASERKAAE